MMALVWMFHPFGKTLSEDFTIDITVLLSMKMNIVVL